MNLFGVVLTRSTVITFFKVLLLVSDHWIADGASAMLDPLVFPKVKLARILVNIGPLLSKITQQRLDLFRVKTHFRVTVQWAYFSIFRRP